jgi:NhaP-type Na+/H+ or K+/H+ antiporter
MKRNLMEKKGIWLVVIGLIFLLLWGILHLRKGIDDQGSLTFGIVLLTMGLLFYFVYGKRTESTDEMLKKIQVMAMATTLSILLVISAICYLIHMWWRQFPVDAGVILGAYIY